MNVIYEVERTDGTVRRAKGENSWEAILTSEDVTATGRILHFSILGANAPVTITLDPDDIFVFKRRTRLLQHFDGVSNYLGTRTIVGKRFPNGSGAYFVIFPNGDVLWTPDPDRLGSTMPTLPGTRERPVIGLYSNL